MSTPEPPAADPIAAPRHRRWRLLLAAVLIMPILLFALYTWVALHWDYSNGWRSGLLQKFSEKGWICKTYEGELWQSVVERVAPNIWLFTVREQRVARQLDTLVGRTIRLHYTEHRGVPSSCFGDTPYFVDSVTVAE